MPLGCGPPLLSRSLFTPFDSVVVKDATRASGEKESDELSLSCYQRPLFGLTHRVTSRKEIPFTLSFVYRILTNRFFSDDQSSVGLTCHNQKYQGNGQRHRQAIEEAGTMDPKGIREPSSPQPAEKTRSRTRNLAIAKTVAS
jgi:hypothetical protein